MIKLLLFVFWLLANGAGFCQDSTAALYINRIVERIEYRLDVYLKEVKDTTIYDDDTAAKKYPLVVHSEYYSNNKNQVEKIVEQSKYQRWTTEISVYYWNEQPILFSSTQKKGDTTIMDFDIYFRDNHLVYLTKRKESKGTPDDRAFLKWSFELLNEYKRTLAVTNK
jgi:hypothetical protein